REPTEHHVRHLGELPLDCRTDVGMIVAVTGGPPGRHAVDQLASVGEHDAAAPRAHDRQRRPCGFHLRVGQPDVAQPRRVPVRPPCPFARHSMLPFLRGCRHLAREDVMTMRSLDEFAAQKLADLDGASLRRRLAATTRLDGIFAERNGRRLVSFCCNDYLNLTHHPAIKAAAIEALHRYGAGAGASRLVTGNHPLFAELERRLARLKGTDSAVVFGSGYLANAGIIPALIGADDLMLIDELAHACLWAGARLSRATILP